MRTRMCCATFVVCTAAVSWLCPFSYAQADDDQISREEFERRLTEIQKQYQQDIAERDRAIAELRQQINRQPDDSDEWLTEHRNEQQKQMLNDMLAEIDAEPNATLTARKPVSFNPDIAVVSDFLGTWSDNRGNNAYNRFDTREVELDMRAAVDPRADGVLILAFARDVENPVFPEDEPLEGPDSEVEVEEAYLFLHDFGIPNLTAKVGRFHVRFGRQNLLHLHNLPTSDPPLVNQAFLAPEALTDSGLSLSYLIPNPWHQYLEVDLELLAGEGAGSESPTLRGDLNVDSPAVNTHLLWNTDLNDAWNLELGGSWLWGHADPENALDVNLLGGDLTLLHTDPTGGFNNKVLQPEFIYGLVDQADGSRNEAWGAYLLAQQQLDKDWYAGVRLDWTEDPNSPDSDAWGVSPYLSWYWNEFLRFRLGYQHRGGDVPDDNVVMLQITWVFGAHPPHPYWAMR